MKRFFSLLLVICLLAAWAAGEKAAPEGAETESAQWLDSEDPEGDPLPVEDGKSRTPGGTEMPGELPEADPEENLPDEDDLEEEILEARELQYGDEGGDVLELQTRLQELKYYTGNLSGRYREGTREAVKTFQGDYGLEKTGVADSKTQSLIYSARYRPLRHGAEGDEVKALQSRLQELGYYKGKISGKFLEGTQKSIRSFQENNGLTATGAADVQTQELLYSDGAAGAGDTPRAAATPAPDGAAAAAGGEEAEDGGTGNVPYSKTLKSGSSGKLVKQLQTRMTELGYYSGPISGNFARQTLRAVKTIQTQNGLEGKGVVDEATWNVIFNDPGIVMPDATPKPTPPAPYAITVDVTNQVTTVYSQDEEGGYTVPVRRMLCSTGTKANPSDVGDWVLNGRHAKWCVFPTWGNSYARYWTRINSNIAFHSVIYTAVDLDAMKTSSYKMLGQRASHGCIRLTVEDAKWVYENIGKGTVVTIREDLPADQELRDALKLPPLQKGTSIPVETPVPTPMPEYHAEEKPEIGNRRLKKGAEGPEVFWVQNRLAELGFYTGYISGRMLNGTVNAIKNFQRSLKVYGTGVINQQLIDQLAPQPEETAAPEDKRSAESEAPAANETPVPSETPAPEEGGAGQAEESADPSHPAPDITPMPSP